MEGDPLTDVLTLASARCVRIGTLKGGVTWALTFPPPQKIKLTAVVKGTCRLAVGGERAPVRLETGDVFVVPAERSYVLASDLKASQLDGLALFTKATDNVATVGDGQRRQGVQTHDEYRRPMEHAGHVGRGIFALGQPDVHAADRLG
jgi:Cupin